MTKTTLISATLLLAVAGVAGAGEWLVNPTVDLFNPLKNHAGDGLDNGWYIMLIDLDGDGWEGVPYDAQPVPPVFDHSTTWQWDANDLELDRGATDTGLFAGGASPSSTLSDTALPEGYSAGDDVWLLWFDLPYDGQSGPGVGTWYGAMFLTDAPELDQEGKFTGSSYTATVPGHPADLQTVPEPTSMLLLVAGGAVAMLRRRKARA